VSPQCLPDTSDIFLMSPTCRTSSESVRNLLIFTLLCCKPYLHAHSHCCFALCSPTYMSLCCTPFIFNPIAPPLLKPQPWPLTTAWSVIIGNLLNYNLGPVFFSVPVPRRSCLQNVFHVWHDSFSICLMDFGCIGFYFLLCLLVCHVSLKQVWVQVLI
jgi:hypothetical protein